MPYQDIKDLPDNVRQHMPEHAQKIFLETYNSAWKEYDQPQKRRGSESQEETAFRVAWAAVKRKYAQSDGQWLPNLDQPQRR